MWTYTLPILVCLLSFTNIRTVIGASRKSPTCDALLSSFNGDTSHVLLPGSEAYAESLGSYYSKQESELMPACIVKPSCTADVATAVELLSNARKDFSRAKSKFAMRSGGHAIFAGSANIAGGVTIDLRTLDSVRVSEDRKVVSIGPGATWADVYKTLEPMGLMVTGGRAAGVGVGGLVTGGGISFFSPRKGLACDNVINYEVVLAGGKVVNANAKENSDLWVALRGGTGNFGVVTRFDVEAFDQGLLWGGFIGFNTSELQPLLKAFQQYTSSAEFDENASYLLSFGIAEGLEPSLSTLLHYTKAVENPSVFQPITSLPGTFSTMRTTNLTDLVTEVGSNPPPGMRSLWVTLSFAPEARTLQASYDRWFSAAEKVRNVPGILFASSLQSIVPATTSKSGPKGGNVLGLDPEEGPLVVYLLSASWSNDSDDALVHAAVRKLLDDLKSDAQDFGSLSPYIYLNYAAGFQDPIAGYGEDNIEKLRKASRKYDPKAVFQKQVPGQFKIPGL